MLAEIEPGSSPWWPRTVGLRFEMVAKRLEEGWVVALQRVQEGSGRTSVLGVLSGVGK